MDGEYWMKQCEDKAKRIKELGKLNEENYEMMNEYERNVTDLKAMVRWYRRQIPADVIKLYSDRENK